MTWRPFGRRRRINRESALDTELRDHLERQAADTAAHSAGFAAALRIRRLSPIDALRAE